ncbi:unnamed protein product [Mucor hiemalis]
MEISDSSSQHSNNSLSYDSEDAISLIPPPSTNLEKTTNIGSEVEEIYVTPVPDFVLNRKKYGSFEDAFAELNQNAIGLFIVVTITSATWENKGDVKRRVYGIVRCHKSKSPARPTNSFQGTPGSRNSSSSRCECPFKWTINRKKIKGNDQFYFFIKALENKHNHAIHEQIFKSHDSQRQLSVDQKKYVEEMMAIGRSPVDMVAALTNRYPEQTFDNRTIYRTKHQIRKSMLNERMPIQLSNTQRASSGLEYPEAEQQQARKKKCRTCQGTGYV